MSYPEETTIILKEHQVDPYQKLSAHVLVSTAALIVAPTGSGKTVVTIKLFKQYLFNTLFVVGPANLEDTWNREAEKYAIKDKLIFISYDTLAGKSGKLNHPWLVIHNGDYYASNNFAQIVANKTMLVFDECQFTKNCGSNRAQASFALSKEIRRQNVKSRIMMLSATPFDKAELAESALKLLGIIRQKELFFYNVGLDEYMMDGYGFNELIEYCQRIAPGQVDQYIPVNISAKAVRMAIFDILINLLKPKLIYSMPKAKISAKFLPEARYSILLPAEMDKFKEAIGLFNRALRNDDGDVVINNGNIGALVKSFQKMEEAKKGLFERRAKYHLNRDPRVKVIIYVWHDETVDYLLEKLIEYRPLRCDGKVSVKKRAKHNALFQEANNEYRVIIAKPTSYGIGISLDDNNGNFPRVTLINSNYHFEKIHQAAGRAYRTNTQSDAICELLYVKNSEEVSIIRAIRRKTDVTKLIVDFNDLLGSETEDDENPTIFPADYPIVME